MQRKLLMVLSMLYCASLNAQTLPPNVADSLKKLTCEMMTSDQEYRGSAISNKIDSLYKNGDTARANTLINRRIAIDSQNVQTLLGITRAYGYPSDKLLGLGSCATSTILIHWSKTWPEWYNSPDVVALFKKELDAGNLPLAWLDAGHFFYISYMKADIALMPVINDVRRLYGLTQYTYEQYTGQERAELLRH